MRVEIDARFLYFDADLFGFYYPVHITFPFSRTQICTGQCIFDRIPAGDATLMVFSETKPLRTKIFIEPDTQGTLNLVPALQILPLSDKKVIEQVRAPLLTETEKKLLSGRIAITNSIQGLFFLLSNDGSSLYDVRTKQSIITPLKKSPSHIARGQKEGEYLFWTEE